MVNQLLSEDLSKVAAALKEAISKDRMDDSKKQARIAQDYYDYKHDILKHRICYVDENGVLREDTYASNVKIPHPFFTELVDQKVQYLLSNPVEFETEEEKLRKYLAEYINADLQVVLQDMIQGASIKAHEYLYARTTEDDKMTFNVADSLLMIMVNDDDHELKAIIRYYDRTIAQGKKNITITYAERWTEEDVTYFVSNEKGVFGLDPAKILNPRPHVIAMGDDGETILGRTYGTIPFYRLSNNARGRNDLEPVKAIIDDYDLMNAFLSNNLHDFQDAIYVVKGYEGDDLSKLRYNIKAKKAVGVSSDGDVSVQTVNIPVEARKLKLEIDRENIYKFGMGFDSAQIGDGNITNVVIKSRYALLDLKCNKAEARLRAMLSWMLNMIVGDINRRYNTAFNAEDIEVLINRETMVNENDIVTNEMNEATAQKARIEALLAIAPYIGDETTLKIICEEYELDYEEVLERIEQQDYAPSLSGGKVPEDVNEPAE